MSCASVVHVMKRMERFYSRLFRIPVLRIRLMGVKTDGKVPSFQNATEKAFTVYTASTVAPPRSRLKRRRRRGAGEVDERADIYALGCVMFEMAAGAPPFMSDGIGEIIAMHLKDEPPPIQARNPGVSATKPPPGSGCNIAPTVV